MNNSDGPKSPNKNIPSEFRTEKLQRYFTVIIFGLLIPGIVLGLITLFLISNISQFYVFLVLTIVILYASIRLLIRVKSELNNADIPFPSTLEGTEILRESNQCKICKRHPLSKKYHIEKIHDIEDSRTMDYFVNCGCVRCDIMHTPNYD
jgi:hypothetical protein